MTALWICLGVIAMLAIWAVTIYNRLVKLRNNRENAFADIDVQLKQRHDLVPQLVATVKGYAAHEQETLEKVIAARNGAVNASTINDKLSKPIRTSRPTRTSCTCRKRFPTLKTSSLQ